MDNFPSELINFTESELASPDGTGYGFHPAFPQYLQYLRDCLQAPLYIESCCRSAEYNRSIGGAEKSLHIFDKPRRAGQQGTLAVDVKIFDSAQRHEVLKCALSLGWSGYLIKGGNLHLDRRDLIGEPRVWFERKQ